MVEILITKKAPERVINKFIRDNNQIQIPFGEIMNAIKTR
jgi:hypothetical protein